MSESEDPVGSFDKRPEVENIVQVYPLKIYTKFKAMYKDERLMDHTIFKADFYQWTLLRVTQYKILTNTSCKPRCCKTVPLTP